MRGPIGESYYARFEVRSHELTAADRDRLRQELGDRLAKAKREGQADDRAHYERLIGILAVARER